MIRAKGQETEEGVFIHAEIRSSTESDSVQDKLTKSIEDVGIEPDNFQKDVDQGMEEEWADAKFKDSNSTVLDSIKDEIVNSVEDDVIEPDNVQKYEDQAIEEEEDDAEFKDNSSTVLDSIQDDLVKSIDDITIQVIHA